MYMPITLMGPAVFAPSNKKKLVVKSLVTPLTTIGELCVSLKIGQESFHSGASLCFSDI